LKRKVLELLLVKLLPESIRLFLQELRDALFEGVLSSVDSDEDVSG